MAINIVLERPAEYGGTDYDGLWKKMIHELFEEFILFFVPSLSEDIDFSVKPEFLQQELFREVIDDRRGKSIADQIVKVYLKDGKEKWILVHIEVQGNADPDFAKRMFRYYYRIYDKFNKDIVTIALITDTSNSYRPDTYHYSFHGTSLTYTYNMFKFTDFKESELMESANPFAIAILAAQYANQTRNNDEKRYRFKYKLFKMILQKAHYPSNEQRMYIASLLYFIDYLLQIPVELSKKLRDEILQTKEGKQMVYIDKENLPLSWAELEVIFRKEGEEKGKKSVARNMLEEGMSVELVAKYVTLSINEVKKIAEEM
ncbi:Rpn family recombination-promoting nuclease/putative transposase [Aquibacillus salsiterrae]|uniref:Rpn family recombination-promoting nuclease/putative transposase n=1 Tax=Aquibacillus salsiterrae TaxID=2950439 RepID=A0A9X3WEM6_9BACI|nr:Rpn family recombination-promoting nuclease/putative transposase [Aquibacillus salsiterrae]MDC3418362.1 Rpn family recombination-promoting nuclease/putative transposase [Aquibacillus salsiterrae]